MQKNSLPEPIYSDFVVNQQPVRNIRAELYDHKGYDAIWRLSNAGFAIRLGNIVIFIDPIFTSPLPEYEMLRDSLKANLLNRGAGVEKRFYNRHDNILKELHVLPLLSQEVESIDYVLITHDHGDHIDPKGLSGLSHLDPTVIAPESCHQDLFSAGFKSDSLIEARFNECHELENFSVTTIESDHGNSKGACGYFIETQYGNIYTPGDGKFDQPAKNKIADLDVDYLLVPINDTNLGVGFAALLTHMLQPRVVIPCHYGYTYPAVRSQGGHPAEFVTALAARNYKLPATDIVILSPGGRMVFA